MTSLNELAWVEFEKTIKNAGDLGIEVEQRPCGTSVLDAGVDAPGGLEAGLAMARIGMSGQGNAAIETTPLGEMPWLWVTVQSDRPLEACYLSQAAHWQIELDWFHAMGSGPACLLNRDLNICRSYEYTEFSDCAVLVLETASLPDDSTCKLLAEKCSISPERLAIIVAPTSSLAGSVQIAARSLETGLHKLHQLGFDLHKTVSGTGRCPVAAPTGNDLKSLGRTNDAMMFASQIWICVKDIQNGELAKLAQRIPSSSSASYGEPFLQTLKNAGGFYAIDPGLFAPAEVTLMSIDNGRAFHAGGMDLSRLNESLEE